MDKITAKVEALRLLMKRENIQAYYVSGTDPHISEYLPDYWKSREFLSGFTGSYGEILITKDKAILWTDSRYFIQAEEQLQVTCFEMHKLRVPDAIPFDQWIVANLSSGDRIGVTGLTMSASAYENLGKKLRKPGMELVLVADLLDEIWDDRPLLPDAEIFELDDSITGMSRIEKLNIIADTIQEQGATLQVITLLDDIAWAFNLRGTDIDYNPVFMGYGIISENFKALFVNEEKIPEEIKQRLINEGISLFNYNSIFDQLGKLRGEKVILDLAVTNKAIKNALHESCEIIVGPSIPSMLKAIKNNVELRGFHSVMVKDGIALVNFLSWFEKSLGNKSITEYTVGRKLAEFRAQQEGFKGESFPPIVGYKAHGAIVHLNVNEQDALPIEKEGILLFDSGGQYLGGTTDITRTIALGKVTQQQKDDFTLVLKGLIALTLAKFPKGTKGCHLDILARKALWDNGLNYGHGTGHGVGHFLAVHEGPMSIRQEYNEHAIVPGMVMSNEPAMYRTGEYGLRTENLIVCVEKEETSYGQFFGFETLTLFPIDKKLVELSLMTSEEIEWLNKYHQKVFDELSPKLNAGLIGFLKEQTSPII